MTSPNAHTRPTVLVRPTVLARPSMLALTGVLAVALTACSSSDSGSGSPAAASGGSTVAASGSASSSDSGASGDGGDAATSTSELAATLTDGTSKATTVHLTLDTAGAAAGADSGSGQGDVETGDDGTTKAFSFDIGTGDTAVSTIYVDGTGYVKLPTAQQTDPTKPWAKVTAGSSNPVIAQLSQSFDQIQTQTSLTQYATIVGSASNFQATGETDVDGVAAQGYSFDIDPASLPNAAQFGDAIAELGPIPTTMTVDGEGRPLQVEETITVAGQTITTTVSFTDYGKSIDVSAPPADQISAE